MKTFRKYQPDQLTLLPPSLRDWLPDGHPALFVGDLIDSLDLSEIMNAYSDALGGQPPYHPIMMCKVLFYAYFTGITSSREIERATWDQVPFRYLSADQHPDHDTLAAFRERHLLALSKLFDQVLKLALHAGLADLNHLAVDGTKVRANASRYESGSQSKFSEREKKIKSVIEKMFEEARETDAREDREIGSKSTYLLPPELRTQERRLKKIQEAKEKMAQEEAEIKRDENAKKPKRKYKKQSEATDSTSNKTKESEGITRNLTDYDSRIMRLPGGNWGQSFNAQAAVDGKHQFIVAADVTNECNDLNQLLPLVSEVRRTTGKSPRNISADTGYFTRENIKSKELKGINLLIPPRKTDLKESKHKRGLKAFPISYLMNEKLQKPENKELYRKRKTIVEPVFGQIKASVQGFSQFTFRGLEKVRQEWQLVCAIHNIHKLYRLGFQPS